MDLLLMELLPLRELEDCKYSHILRGDFLVGHHRKGQNIFEMDYIRSFTRAGTYARYIVEKIIV